MPYGVRFPSKTSFLALGVVALSLSACVIGPTVDHGTERIIKAHYAKHATEEDGKCRTPRIDTVQSYRPIGEPGTGSEVVAIRYSYYDPNADMDANWNALFHINQPCGGIAERNFALTRTELGYRVINMSGERREDGRAD